MHHAPGAMEPEPPQFPAHPGLMIASPVLSALPSPVVLRPAPLHNIATTPEPLHNMDVMPESAAIMDVMPEFLAIMNVAPEATKAVPRRLRLLPVWH